MEAKKQAMHSQAWESTEQLSLLLIARGFSKKDALRIVSCAIACEGMDNDSLTVERGGFARVAKECFSMRLQRDELLAALQSIVADADATYQALKHGTPVVSIAQFQRIAQARALIAKASS